MKISVCIPCIYDKHRLLKDILYDFVNQTKKPHEIIVLLKPTDAPASFYNNLYNTMLDTNIITFIAENKNSTIGYAKNRCVEKTSCDVVCMADSDDRIHYKKLEYVEEFFRNTEDADGLVHRYFGGLNWSSYPDVQIVDPKQSMLDLREEKIDIEKFELEECAIREHPDSIFKDTASGGYQNVGKTTGNLLDFHNAHCSFRKSIFESIRFDESWDNFGADDSIFIKGLIKEKHKVYYTPERLIYFNQLTYYQKIKDLIETNWKNI